MWCAHTAEISPEIVLKVPVVVGILARTVFTQWVGGLVGR